MGAGIDIDIDIVPATVAGEAPPAAAAGRAWPPGWQPVPLPGGEVALLPALPLPVTPEALLAELMAEVPWRQEHVRLFGREVAQPRLSAWFGDAGARYRYSGLALSPRPWTPRLQDLRERVQAAAGARFDACLLNLYRDGADAIGAHADDEPELGPRPVIAALTLGAARPIVFRPRSRADGPAVRVPAPAGSLLVMRGDTQARWLHGVPRTARPVGPRLSLTFRRIVDAPRGP